MKSRAVKWAENVACTEEINPYKIHAAKPEVKKKASKETSVHVCQVVPALLNYAARHEGVWGDWRHASTYSSTSALDGVGGQLYAPAALPLGRGTLRGFKHHVKKILKVRGEPA
jgi:hypothetical protein